MSRWIDVLVLVALMAVAGGIVLPAFPLSSFGFAAGAASLVRWRLRPPAQSLAQVIWAVKAEAAQAPDAQRF